MDASCLDSGLDSLSDSLLKSLPAKHIAGLKNSQKLASMMLQQISSRDSLSDICQMSFQFSVSLSLSSLPSNGLLCTVLLLPLLVCSDASQLPLLLMVMAQSQTTLVVSLKCQTFKKMSANVLMNWMLQETLQPPSEKVSLLDLHALSLLLSSVHTSQESQKTKQLQNKLQLFTVLTFLNHTHLLVSLSELCFHTGSLPLL